MKHIITVIILILCISCKSSKQVQTQVSIVGVWEYEKVEIDLNTILPFDNLVEKTFSTFSNIAQTFKLINAEIEFTNDGKFISKNINCSYQLTGNKIKFNQSLLEVAKVNTVFLIEQRENRLVLIYDAKDTVKPYLKGIKGLALSSIKKGDILLVFKRKS